MLPLALMNNEIIPGEIHVLITDDEKDFREILARRLGRRGIRAVLAENGREALRLLREQKMEIVVMDVKMPEMNGIEALRRIKDQYPLVEVILLTGHANTRDGVEGIKSGAFDYLSKPVEIEHLLNKIRQAHDRIQRILNEKREAEFMEMVKQQMVVAERLSALGTMTVGVAHEINNPLAVIQESAGWLQQILVSPQCRDIPRKADFEKALDRILKAVGRASNITRQLLQASRTQWGEMDEPAEMSEVSLKALAEESVALLKPVASGKKIVIRAPQPPPMAWTDSRALLQVLVNLLTNAIHATAEDGEITITLSESVEEAGISVTDTGCGISEENLTRIFEPFFTTKEVGQGTGMGLYIAWKIVAKLGGLINVESRAGKGSTFTITLPAKK